VYNFTTSPKTNDNTQKALDQMPGPTQELLYTESDQVDQQQIPDHGHVIPQINNKGNRNKESTILSLVCVIVITITVSVLLTNPNILCMHIMSVSDHAGLVGSARARNTSKSKGISSVKKVWDFFLKKFKKKVN
jgi:hypothetical protein